MKIKAADDLRGELVLGSINKSLIKGKELVIADDAFWNDDIQLMLKARKIAVVEGGENFPDVTNIVEERIAIQSAYRKPIELTGISFPVKPGQVYSITRRQLGFDSVQQALDMGLIVRCDPDTKPYDPDDDNPAEGDVPSPADPNDPPSPNSVQKRPDPLKDVDIEMLDDAEKFKLLGQAKTIARDKPAQPKDAYIYDPHNTRAGKPNTPPNAHTYDPNQSQVARPSNKLPVRGAIKPVGMTQSPLQESQLKQANAPAPKRIGGGAPKRIRPVGGGGGGGFADDGVECEIL